MTLNEIAQQQVLLPTLLLSDAREIDINPAFSDFCHMTLDDLNAVHLNETIQVDKVQGHCEIQSLDGLLQAALSGEPLLFSGSVIDNNYFPIECQMTCSYCEESHGHGHWVIQFQCFSNKSIDVVTKMPNGWAFAHKAKHYFSFENLVPQNLALLVVNIDNFATINYRYGFAVGDAYLTRFGENLRQLGSEFGLTVRFSNARFGLLIDRLENMQSAQAKSKMLALCERICQDSLEGIVIDEQCTITKSLSLGLCLYDEGYDSYHQMEINADTAMLKAARYSHSSFELADGKSSLEFYNRKIIIDELPQAIIDKRFELYYQPQYCLRSEEIIGFEALSRWHHPQLGHISPVLFIEVAEEIGMHFDFDLMVVRKVCEQLRYWLDKQYQPVRISVNISFKTLEMSTFVLRVFQILREFDCPTNLLEFEITETSNAKNLETLSENIQALVDLGIRIAIDDFGTGYSSLSLIRGYYRSIDTLKLDRSLIEDICTNHTAKRFAQHIVDLGKVLDLKILAEGVENEQQKVLLNAMGCHLAQGFHFNKALKKSTTQKLLKKRPS